jgi:hypothetical protein
MPESSNVLLAMTRDSRPQDNTVTHPYDTAEAIFKTANIELE